MNGEEFVASCVREDGTPGPTPRGDAWGKTPLWTFANPSAEASIDVHAKDEAPARIAAAEAWDERQARLADVG